MAVPQRPRRPAPGSHFIARVTSTNGILPEGPNVLATPTEFLNLDGERSDLRDNLVSAPPPDSVHVIDRMVLEHNRPTREEGTNNRAMFGLRISSTADGSTFSATDLPIHLTGEVYAAEPRSFGAKQRYDIRNLGLVLEGLDNRAGFGNTSGPEASGAKGQSLGVWGRGIPGTRDTTVTVFGRTLSRQEAVASGDLRGTTTSWASGYAIGSAPHSQTLAAAAPTGYCHIIRTLMMSSYRDEPLVDQTGGADADSFLTGGNFWIAADAGTGSHPVKPIARLFCPSVTTVAAHMYLTNCNIVLGEADPIIVRFPNDPPNSLNEVCWVGYETVPVSKQNNGPGTPERVVYPGIIDAKTGSFV